MVSFTMFLWCLVGFEPFTNQTLAPPLAQKHFGIRVWHDVYMAIYLVTCGHMSSSSLKRDIKQPNMQFLQNENSTTPNMVIATMLIHITMHYKLSCNLHDNGYTWLQYNQHLKHEIVHNSTMHVWSFCMVSYKEIRCYT